jgi:hypothetical protein
MASQNMKMETEETKPVKTWKESIYDYYTFVKDETWKLGVDAKNEAYNIVADAACNLKLI